MVGNVLRMFKYHLKGHGSRSVQVYCTLNGIVCMISAPTVQISGDEVVGMLPTETTATGAIQCFNKKDMDGAIISQELLVK